MSDTIYMRFGKFKGKPIGEVPDDYLEWVHDNNVGKMFPEMWLYLDENLEAIRHNAKLIRAQRQEWRKANGGTY